MNATLMVKQAKVQYRTIFNEWISSAQLARHMLTVPTDTETVNLAALGDIPRIRKITGDIPFNTLGAFKYNVTVEQFGAGLKIEDHLLRRNVMSDQFNQALRLMPMRQAQHVSRLILETTLPALSSTICLDGVNFYSASHPIDGGTQSNLDTETVTSIAKPTTLEAAKIFDKARILLRKIRSDTGEYINPANNAYTLFCPIEWEDVFIALFDRALVRDQTNNAVAVDNAEYRKYMVDVIGTAHIPASGTVPIHLWANGNAQQSQIAFVEYDPAHMNSDKDAATEWNRFVTTGRYAVAPYRYEGAVLINVS